MYNFAALLDHNLGLYPDKVVLTCGDRRITNRRLFERVNALAAGLRSLGIGPGQFVALLLDNHKEFFETILAVNRVGAAFLPINCRLAPDEWQFALRHAGATALIADAEYKQAIESILPDLSGLHHCVMRDAVSDGKWLDYEKVIQAHLGEIVQVAEVAEDDLHRLMFTSGTAARPKGVPISHGNVLWKNFAHIVDFRITERDVALVVGPLYHVGGLDIPAIDTLYAGGSIVILLKFDARAMVQCIESERISCVWLAPIMMNRVLQLPDLPTYDVSSLRLVIFGGEKTPRSLIENFSAAFPKTWLSDCWGLTETVSGDTFNDPNHMLSKVGSVGRPILHMEVRIVDDEGQPVQPRMMGEIVIRGPKLFSGYWRDEAATAHALRNGWLHTGDVGWLDEDGYLYVEDRKKDIIISGGENIASAEVERVIYEHADVYEAAVVAIPHPVWGQTPRAFVVVKPGSRLDQETLQTFCRRHLAKFKVPAEILFIDALPRTASGKVLKRTLREWDSGALPSS